MCEEQRRAIHEVVVVCLFVFPTGLACLELRIRGLTSDDMERLAQVTQHTLCSLGFQTSGGFV